MAAGRFSATTLLSFPTQTCFLPPPSPRQRMPGAVPLVDLRQPETAGRRVLGVHVDAALRPAEELDRRRRRTPAAAAAAASPKAVWVVALLERLDGRRWRRKFDGEVPRRRRVRCDMMPPHACSRPTARELGAASSLASRRLRHAGGGAASGVAEDFDAVGVGRQPRLRASFCWTCACAARRRWDGVEVESQRRVERARRVGQAVVELAVVAGGVGGDCFARRESCGCDALAGATATSSMRWPHCHHRRSRIGRDARALARALADPDDKRRVAPRHWTRRGSSQGRMRSATRAPSAVSAPGRCRHRRARTWTASLASPAFARRAPRTSAAAPSIRARKRRIRCHPACPWPARLSQLATSAAVAAVRIAASKPCASSWRRRRRCGSCSCVLWTTAATRTARTRTSTCSACSPTARARSGCSSTPRSPTSARRRTPCSRGTSASTCTTRSRGTSGSRRRRTPRWRRRCRRRR